MNNFIASDCQGWSLHSCSLMRAFNVGLHDIWTYEKYRRKPYRSDCINDLPGKGLLWFPKATYTEPIVSKYSRASVARTLMARLLRLFRTRSGVPWKNPIAADWG